MKKTRLTKKAIISLIILVAFSVCSLSTMAASGLTEVRAYLNQSIKIVFNGQTQVLKDAKGATVYPITYNGTTYVPLRAVSNIFGEAVEWDGNTSTAYLGSREKKPLDLMTLGYAGNEYTWAIKEKPDLTVPGSEGDVTFKDGLIWNIWSGFMSSGGTSRQIGWDIPSGYSSLTVAVYAPKATNIKLYAKDAKTIFYNFNVDANVLTTKVIDITGVSYLSLGADSKTYTSDVYNVRIFEPTIQ